MFFSLLILWSVFCIAYTSVFEWILHRYLMHAKPFGISYAFNAHALIHHRLFGGDITYEGGDRGNPPEKNIEKVPMAWWNGPVLVATASLPFLLVAVFTGFWWMYVTSVVVLVLYYCIYEYLHWCMHLPRPRRFQKVGLLKSVFIRLNGHHLLHHRYPTMASGCNFNVVFPFADWIFGTLLIKARKPFVQPRSDFVPDVQPDKDNIDEAIRSAFHSS